MAKGRKPAFEPRCSRALSRCSPSALHPSPRSSLCANRSRWGTIGRTSRRTAMPVIDVQVHPFDRNHPGRPWASPSHGLDSATGEEMVAAMNSAGVDGAIMISSFSAYEYDPSYALEVYNTYPDKLERISSRRSRWFDQQSRGEARKWLKRHRSPSRMRKNAVLATRFVEFSFETRAMVAENRVL